MTALDNYLIDYVFQPLADRLARWASCYAIAEFLLCGVALEDIAEIAWAQGWRRLTSLLALPFLVLFVFVPRHAERQQSSTALPRLRHAFRGWRYLQTFFALLAASTLPRHWTEQDLLTVANDGASILFYLALYFLACRHNPPAQRTPRLSRDLATGGADA